MTTVDITLTLPQPLAQAARASGLLTAEALERLLRDELHRRRTDRLFEAADQLAALPEPLSDDKIQAEIQAARAARRGADARRP